MRTPLDQYPTPAWQTLALLRRVKPSGVVLEPCSGEGAIENVLVQKCSREISCLKTNDIDLKYTLAQNHLDATLPILWSMTGMVDWTVTNPPFNQAITILKHAYAHSRIGVAFLLRLSFLEPTEETKRGDVTYPERSVWLADNPPASVIVLPRWKYNPDSKGTDSCTTAWMVWLTTKEWQFRRPIDVVSKDEMRELMNVRRP